MLIGTYAIFLCNFQYTMLGWPTLYLSLSYYVLLLYNVFITRPSGLGSTTAGGLGHGLSLSSSQPLLGGGAAGGVATVAGTAQPFQLQKPPLGKRRNN